MYSLHGKLRCQIWQRAAKPCCAMSYSDDCYNVMWSTLAPCGNVRISVYSRTTTRLLHSKQHIIIAHLFFAHHDTFSLTPQFTPCISSHQSHCFLTTSSFLFLSFSRLSFVADSNFAPQFTIKTIPSCESFFFWTSRFLMNCTEKHFQPKSLLLALGVRCCAVEVLCLPTVKWKLLVPVV